MPVVREMTERDDHRSLLDEEQPASTQGYGTTSNAPSVRSHAKRRNSQHFGSLITRAIDGDDDDDEDHDWVFAREEDYKVEKHRAAVLPCQGAAVSVASAASLNQFAKKASQFALLRIEMLSKTESQLLITCFYMAIVACTVVSIVDYSYMWKCTNICDSIPDECSGHSDVCMQDHLETNGTVSWSGSVHGLTVLNRFMHMTFEMDNPNLHNPNSSLVDIVRLNFRQIAYTTSSPIPQNISFSIALSCSFSQPRCSTLQLPVTDLAWSSAYNMTITLVEPLESIVHELDTVTITFRYQRSTYTIVELIVRCCMLVYTLLAAARFVAKLRLLSLRDWLTEQQYILILFFFLFLFLDPWYPLATYDTRVGKANKGWAVIQFLEFHASTYFFLYVQVFMVMFLTSVRRSDGRVHTSTHVLCALWFMSLASIDLAVGLLNNSATSDYSSTFAWFFFTHDLDFSSASTFLYISLIVLEAAWVMWFLRSLLRTFRKMNRMPYFPTRHRQLAFRYLVFLFGGFVFYQLITSVISWSIRKGFGITYRASQEIGSVTLSFVIVHLVAHIYLPAFGDDDAPPAPGDPDWRWARWKRIKWRPEWYVWLQNHGGSLYFFIHRAEQDAYLKAQAEGTEQPERKKGKEGFFVARVLNTALWLSDQIKEVLVKEPLRHLQNALFSEGYVGCPRLFFCLEVCVHMLNLSYRVYWTPRLDDRIRYAATLERMGENMSRAIGTIQTSCTHTVVLAATYAAVVSAMSKAGQLDKDRAAATPKSPTRRAKKFRWPKFSFSRSSAAAQPDDQAAAQLDEQGPELEKYGYDLYDCIETAGAQAFIAIRYKNGERPRRKSSGSGVKRTGADHVVIVFRGTSNRAELNVDMNFSRKPWEEMKRQGDASFVDNCCDALPCSKVLQLLPMCHSGFMSLWSALRETVMQSVTALLQTLDSHPTIYITGHSLGGALACLCAYSVSINLGWLPVVYTFGSPKLGNREFQRRYNAAVPNTFRVVNEYDFVAHWSLTWGNFHVGHEICFGRHGGTSDFLVEPTWIEQTFHPIKKGGDRYVSHSLVKYAENINCVSERFGLASRCLEEEDECPLMEFDPALAAKAPSGDVNDVV
ncbi:Phospholipase A(1) DAD1 [Diplonema papillatum]|nr:Phospholipase A(1) DAD1 [Diplonema papillatum]